MLHFVNNLHNYYILQYLILLHSPSPSPRRLPLFGTNTFLCLCSVSDETNPQNVILRVCYRLHGNNRVSNVLHYYQLHSCQIRGTNMCAFVCCQICETKGGVRKMPFMPDSRNKQGYTWSVSNTPYTNTYLLWLLLYSR